jgi:hypothetical protein
LQRLFASDGRLEWSLEDALIVLWIRRIGFPSDISMMIPRRYSSEYIAMVIGSPLHPRNFASGSALSWSQRHS